MKKLVALLLVAVVVMASAFAFSFRSVGIETGSGYFLSGDMDIIDNLDIYVRLGYTGRFDLSFGGQYKVADFKVSHTQVDFRPGLQLGFGFGNGFAFRAHLTAQLAFDVDHFTAFVRPGIGLSLYTIKYEYMDKRYTSTDFSFIIETGVAYLF